MGARWGGRWCFASGLGGRRAVVVEQRPGSLGLELSTWLHAARAASALTMADGERRAQQWRRAGVVAGDSQQASAIPAALTRVDGEESARIRGGCWSRLRCRLNLAGSETNAC